MKFETDLDVNTNFDDELGGAESYAELTPTYGRGTPGDGGAEASRGWIGTDEDEAHHLYSVAFGGEHQRARGVLNYDLYYSRARTAIANDTELNTLMEPDYPWMLFEYDVIDARKGLVLFNSLNDADTPTDLTRMSEGELQEGSARKIEEVYSARVDYERKFTGERAAFALKTGGKYHVSRPRFDQTVSIYEMGDGEEFPCGSRGSSGATRTSVPAA